MCVEKDDKNLSVDYSKSQARCFLLGEKNEKKSIRTVVF